MPVYAPRMLCHPFSCLGRRVAFGIITDQVQHTLFAHGRHLRHIVQRIHRLDSLMLVITLSPHPTCADVEDRQHVQHGALDVLELTPFDPPTT